MLLSRCRQAHVRCRAWEFLGVLLRHAKAIDPYYDSLDETPSQEPRIVEFLGVWGLLGFRVWGLGYLGFGGFWGLGLGVFRISLGFGMWGSLRLCYFQPRPSPVPSARHQRPNRVHEDQCGLGSQIGPRAKEGKEAVLD